MSADAVVVEHLSRKYRLYTRASDRLKEVVLRRPYHHDFWALQDVTFRIPRGQTLGIVGENGSGKSTLLQVLAGVLQPTRGRVKLHGRVAALLELGAGFNPEFTGRENVLLAGAIMGIPAAEMRRRFDSIATFAELGQFIEQPVKTYSSGMYVRLAFATAINVDPDILLVDETLAVGDAYFQYRCLQRMAALQARGVTIVLVSHDVGAIQELCQRALWIANGRVADDGPPERVVAGYLTSLFGSGEDACEAAAVALGTEDRLGTVPDEPLPPPHVDRRVGDGAARVVGVGVFDGAGRAVTSVLHGRAIELRVRVRFERALARPVVGWILRDRLGTILASASTARAGCELPPTAAGDTYTVRFVCEPPRLHPGYYAFTVMVTYGEPPDSTTSDWIDHAVTLEITGDVPMDTLMRFPTQCAFERDAGPAP